MQVESITTFTHEQVRLMTSLRRAHLAGLVETCERIIARTTPDVTFSRTWVRRWTFVLALTATITVVSGTTWLSRLVGVFWLGYAGWYWSARRSDLRAHQEQIDRARDVRDQVLAEMADLPASERN